MLRSPQRLSLVVQTVAILQEHLASRSGGTKLESERELCRQLRVSRPTLRAALDQLTRQGRLEGGPGRRRVIITCGPGARGHASAREVVVLSPVPLHEVEPRVLFWIDELRHTLAKAHYGLTFLERPGCYRRRAEHALEDLAGQLRPAVWLLYLSTRALQEWFFARGLPTLIPGSPYESVRLPSVDVDYRAACQHAVGRFLAKGHRRLVLLNPESAAAGDLESEQGFVAAAGARPGTHAWVARHDGTRAGVCQTLDSLLAQAVRPTAFLVSRPAHALTAVGHLVQRGMRFPEEAALIARDHEGFLESAVPSIARYHADPVAFAQRLSRTVLEMASGGAVRATAQRLVPRLVPGRTLG